MPDVDDLPVADSDDVDPGEFDRATIRRGPHEVSAAVHTAKRPVIDDEIAFGDQMLDRECALRENTADIGHLAEMTRPPCRLAGPRTMIGTIFPNQPLGIAVTTQDDAAQPAAHDVLIAL